MVSNVWFYKYVHVRRYLKDIFLKSMWFTLTLGTLDIKFSCALYDCAENLYLCRKLACACLCRKCAGKFGIFNKLLPKCWYFLDCFWFCNKQVQVRRFLESFSIYSNSLLICLNNKYLESLLFMRIFLNLSLFMIVCENLYFQVFMKISKRMNPII